MTPQDNWQQELARLARLQGQLEQQQRNTATRVDDLSREVDRRMDSLRRDMEQQFRDKDLRVNSLERSRDTVATLFWASVPLVAAVAMVIIIVIAAIASREQRQESGAPEQRSPSAIDAPPGRPGSHLQPGLAVAGAPYLTPRRKPGNHGRRSQEDD